MAQSYSWVFLAICATLLVLVLLSWSATTADAGGGTLGTMEMTWMPSISMEVEEEEEEEFQLDNEINRRMLASTRHISYAAMQRDSVPCSRRGASYYHCQPGAQANPYHRGCSAITRCRH